jgi:S1-C subfamily serine protease
MNQQPQEIDHSPSIFMRHFLILPLFLFLSCQPQKKDSSKIQTSSPAPLTEAPTPAWDVRSSVVRINSTQQSWNNWQPWEKNPPRMRRALAAIIGPQLAVTTAELVVDATYLEFESADGSRFSPARVIAVDHEVNLALLGPASEEEGVKFFAGTTHFEISKSPKIGDSLQVLQLEDNSLPILTPGTLQSVDVSSSLLPDQSFLTYFVKASMQSASSSYTLPVLNGRELAGVLLGYNSKDQLCDVVSTDILARFVKEASSGDYGGFPSLGVSISRTEDTSFRQWLKLADDQGGIYIRSVRKGGAAELAGVQKGDVLLAVDGQAIDRRGYYQHPNYGSLSWGHLIRGEKSGGDSVKLSLLREGKPLEIVAKVVREDEKNRLVPNHLYDKAPNYLVKGGLIFQELSRPFLEGFGEEWRSRAPLNLLDAFENPEKYEKSIDRVVFLSAAIPTPATIGYEPLRNLIVRKVNGREIRDMKSLIKAFDEHDGLLHSIEFTDENLTVNLDESISTAVDSQLLQRGLTRLSRAE